MHPMGYYETLRQGREELLRQAAQHRLARQGANKRWWEKLHHLEWPKKLNLKQAKGV